MNKKKRVLYNLVVGIGSKVLLMVLGFLVPKLYIDNYGSELNGLLSSISQVFAYLALLEAGVGTATTQALYDPIAHNDQKRINGIMSAASSFYRRTGVLYGLGVVIFAVVYALTVSGGIGKTTVFILILLSGGNGVLNYFFQAKYFAMLNAEGKGYVHVAIGTAVSFFTTISKLILLYNKLNIVFVYTAYFLLALIQNIAISVYIHTHYRSLDCNSKPDYKAIEQSKSVLVHQISSLVFSNTDVLILTVFCDLNTVSIYAIYNMVAENLVTILNIIFGSFTAALGLTYQENKERFVAYYDMFELGTWFISFTIMTITLLLYNPFIALYTAKADIQYVDALLPILFVLCKLLSLVRMPGVNAVNIAGHFRKTQMRSVIESIINLTVSLLLVYFWGIYGVLFGTIAALSYRTIDFILYTNKNIVYRKPRYIIKRIITNIFTMMVLFLGLHKAINVVDIRSFIFTGFFLLLFVTAVYLLVNIIGERKNPNLITFLKHLTKITDEH